MGQPLEIADRVVAGVAHGPAAERRQFRQVDGADGLDLPAQLVQGIGRIRNCRVTSVGCAGGRNARIGVRRHPAAVGLDLEERVGGQETVAADLFAAHDALEQAGAAAGVDLVEGADRASASRSDQAAIDGHQLGRRVASFRKALEVGSSGRAPVRVLVTGHLASPAAVCVDVHERRIHVVVEGTRLIAMSRRTPAVPTCRRLAAYQRGRHVATPFQAPRTAGHGCRLTRHSAVR